MADYVLKVYLSSARVHTVAEENTFCTELPASMTYE